MENEELQEVQEWVPRPPRRNMIIITIVLLLALVGIFALAKSLDGGPRVQTETTTATAAAEQTTTPSSTVQETVTETTTKPTTVQATTTTTATTAETATQTIAATVTAAAVPTVTPLPTAVPETEPNEGEKVNYVLVVYKGSQTVVAYIADSNGNYDPKQAHRNMICSTGTSANRTPNGTFKIYDKHMYRALVGGVYGQHCSRFNGSILFHSVPISSEASTIEEGRSMMNIEEYNKLGSPASHGCVRMLVGDARWIYLNCEFGTKVIVTDDYSPVGRGGKPAIKRYPPYTNALGTYGWDPTDPHSSNPYNSPETVAVQSISINKKQAAMEPGKTLTLKAEVKPENAETSIIWSSSDETVATVTSKGKVKALKEGEVIITAMTATGNKMAACMITVAKKTTATTTKPKTTATTVTQTADAAQTTASSTTTVTPTTTAAAADP